MGFSGIGIWEIVLVLVVILIVLGPRRLPEIARTLGKTVRAIRKASADLTATVSRELEETKSETPPSKTKTPETGNAIKPPKTENLTTGKTPSITDKSGTDSPDDQSTKPEGHQQRNE
jgi:Tat protein translocase TatB subunit